jgi:hypothetical protein
MYIRHMSSGALQTAHTQRKGCKAQETHQSLSEGHVELERNPAHPTTGSIGVPMMLSRLPGHTNSLRETKGIHPPLT